MTGKQSTTLFVLGIFAVFILVVIGGFVGRMFQDTFPGAGSKVPDEALTPGVDIPGDPLITVVPEEVRGGYPHVLDTDPVRGASEPVVTLVEFGDYECEACAGMDPVIAQLLQEYPTQLQHVWKDFPIPILHEYSDDAARAARCAQEQGRFWEYHDYLYANQSIFSDEPWTDIASEMGLDRPTFEECMNTNKTEQVVVQGYFVGRSLEVDTAPSFFVNKRIVPGAQTYEALKAIIDQEIVNAADGSDE